MNRGSTDLVRTVINKATKQIHEDAEELVLAALSAGVPLDQISVEFPLMVIEPNIMGCYVRIGFHIESCLVYLWH
ncbi:hypothetical protein [Vibrio harveyi]|uniref:hypothetical protein n=1 Tax=Vibrio harveyi group TaxID=717610 RepID=UPI00238020C6|nr:hypothetical protein [Vibrio harveyi]